MAYNKAREEKEWKRWKEQEEKNLRKYGADESMIQELRRMDWEDFNAERRYREHQAPFPEYENFQVTEIGEPEIDGIQPLLENIEDERLLHILLESDRKTLQILLLKIMGFSIREIAEKMEMPENTVYTRMKRLRKKIKNIKKSEQN